MGSCSFKINNVITKGASCFAEFRSNLNAKKEIIIEEYKQEYFGQKYCLEFINDLKEIGFEFDSVKVNKNNSIIIDVTLMNNISYIIAFGMVVRYLWEGKHGGVMNDKFYHVINVYKKLVNSNYKNLSKLELLCISHSIGIIKMNNDSHYRYNTNHFWCFRAGCRIIKDVNIFNNINHINKYMSFPYKYKLRNSYPGDAVEIASNYIYDIFKNFNLEKDIDKLYEYLTKETENMNK